MKEIYQKFFIIYLIFCSCCIDLSISRKVTTSSDGAVAIYDSSPFNDFYASSNYCTKLYRINIVYSGSITATVNHDPEIPVSTTLGPSFVYDGKIVLTFSFSMITPTFVGIKSLGINIQNGLTAYNFTDFYQYECVNATTSKGVLIVPYTFVRNNKFTYPYFSALYQIQGLAKPFIISTSRIYDNFYNLFTIPQGAISFITRNVSIVTAGNKYVDIEVPYNLNSLSPVELISFSSWMNDNNDIKAPQYMVSKAIVRSTVLNSFTPNYRSIDPENMMQESNFAVERVGQDITFMTFPQTLNGMVPPGTQLKLQPQYIDPSMLVITDASKTILYKTTQSAPNGEVSQPSIRNVANLGEIIFNVTTHGGPWYNLNIKLQSIDQNFPLFDLGYPFSFRNGTSTNFTRGFSIPYSYAHASNWCMKMSSLYFMDITQCIGATSVDIDPPYLSSIFFTPLAENYYLATAKVYDQSGFLKAVGLKNRVLFSYKDIVDGTVVNGTYEFVILKNDIKSIFSSEILIYDRATNYYSFYIYNLPLTNYFDLFPYSILPALSDIIDVYFKYNNLDLSNSGIKNTVYLKTKNTNIPYYFVPTINVGLRNIWVQDITTFNWIPFIYDPVKDLYSADFYMPSRPISTYLVYTIIAYPDAQFINSDLLYLPNSQFKYTSSKGDELPPLVTSITLMPSSSVTIATTTTIGWTIHIQDSINGFSNGMVTVFSDLDIGGVNYTLTNNRGDIYNAVFDVFFEVSPNCANQVYRIGYMRTEDLLGYAAEYNPITPAVSLTPLLSFSNMDDYNINILCGARRETTPPKLLSLLSTGVSSIVNIKSESRSFQITLETKDDESGISIRHPPTLYLTAAGFEIIKVPCQYSSTQGDVVAFICSGTLPYMFAYGTYIYYSVYGITDNQMNFRGYTTFDLQDHSQPIYLPTSSADDNQPFITGFTSISYEGGDFIFYGRKFNYPLLVLVNFQNQTGSQYVDMPIVSSTTSTIKIKLPPMNSIFSFKVISNQISSNIISVQPTGTPITISKCSGGPVCGGPTKGTCTSAGCVCIYPYFGLDCASQIVKIDPTVNPTKPNTELNTTTSTVVGGKTVSYSSLVSIRSINELNQYGTVIKSYDFKEWTMISSLNNTLYQYNTTYSGTSSIKVDIQFFETQSQVVFAERVLEIPAQTLKYSITLSPYSFESQLNSLQLVMAAQLNQNETEIDSCSNQEISNSTETKLLKLQLNDHVLLGRFIDISLVDGRITQITNNIISSVNETLSPTNPLALIGINLPFFRSSIVCDPDFSVLIDSVDASKKDGSICNLRDGDGKSGLTKSQLIGIIIGSVCFGLIIIIIGGFFVYKKYLRYSAPVIKLKNLGNN